MLSLERRSMLLESFAGLALSGLLASRTSDQLDTQEMERLAEDSWVCAIKMVRWYEENLSPR